MSQGKQQILKKKKFFFNVFSTKFAMTFSNDSQEHRFVSVFI